LLLEALDADRQAIDPQLAVGDELLLLEGAGVGFQGDLDVVANGMRCSTPLSKRPSASALNRLGVPPPKKIELISRPYTACRS
jgi:hypothetical protein